MKYSLRSLMIGVTVFCALLGVVVGRIEYLRRWMEFHERESERIFLLYASNGFADGDDLVLTSSCHEQVSHRYRIAMYFPWRIVDDSPPDQFIIDEKKDTIERRQGTWADGDRIEWQKVEEGS